MICACGAKDKLFYDPSNLIQKDEDGYYRIWYCSKCGRSFKNRNLDTK